MWKANQCSVTTDFLSMCFLQVDVLAHRWRYPTVSIHGIEGAFSDPGTKTVIPAKVTAKFSIRQVPNMDPAMVKKQVNQDVNSLMWKIAKCSIFFFNNHFF